MTARRYPGAGRIAMTLYLVRHGRASAGVEELDPGLDVLGREQALATARALGRVRASRLVVSPLRRTRETAVPIAEALGLSPEVRQEVAEVFDPRLDAGARRELLGPLLSGLWSEQPPELREWRARVVRTLLELVRGQVVVVSHFVAISVAIGEALGSDRVSPMPMPNASITTIEAGSAGLVLVRGADVGHLSADQVTLSHSALGGSRP